MSNSTGITTISAAINNFPFIWRQVKFGLFLFGQLVSFPCYIFILYHLLATRVARNMLHNHAIILILIYNFMTLTIDIPMTMDYWRWGTPRLIPALCLLHQYVDYGIWYGAVFLMLWTSIERHILIFHSMRVATPRGRLLFHYIPLAVFSLYAPILFLYLIFIYPCTHVFVARNELCGAPCYYRSVPGWFIWYDSIFNYIIPILLIVVFGVALLLRVIIQKRRLRQGIEWGQHRKMILQLILVSSCYLIFDLPFIFIYIMQWCGIPTLSSANVSAYISPLTHVPAMILPYATLVTLVGVKEKLRALVTCRYNRQAIAPSTTRA